MLTELIKYSGSFAKVKAMSSNLLKEEDYKALLSKTTVNDVAAYLKNNTNYKKDLQNISEANIHRGELEAILQESKEKEYIKLFKFERGKNKGFLHTFIQKYEIEVLKELLRMLESGLLITYNDTSNEYYKKHMTIDIPKLIRSHNITNFIENLKGSPYYRILSPLTSNAELLNIFSIEMTLDIFYFTNTWKLKEKLLGRKDRKIVQNSFGSEIDILNIMWILRCKKYFNTQKELIYSFIIPIRYKLNHEQIVGMVEAKNIEDILEIIKKTPYYSVFEKDDKFMEQYYYKYINNKIRKTTKTKPFSINTIMSYIHSKETEVNNIIKITEGIRYKLDMSEIERYLVRDGGDEDGS